MSEKQGVKELTDVVKLGVAIANAGVMVAADKKVDLADLPTIMAILPLVPSALEGISKVPAEAADLDSAEGAALLATIATDLALPDGKAKAIVMASMKVAVDLKDLVEAIVKDAPAPVVQA